jgi:hypothetical protein
LNVISALAEELKKTLAAVRENPSEKRFYDDLQRVMKDHERYMKELDALVVR